MPSRAATVRCMSARLLSADDLLHGAIYALEHGGNLLGDAVGLWQRTSYSSGVILAVFAREEIGRSKICAAAWREVLAGANVSTEDLAKRCAHHVAKLKAGRVGLTLRLTAEPGQGAFIKALARGPDAEGYREARERVDAMFKALTKRDEAGETHALRCRAQYVDTTPTGWNRPAETSREESSELICDVANAYAVRRNHALDTDARRLPGDPTPIGPAARAWPDCPTLPTPVWPE